MLFSELYGAYYRTVAEILRLAVRNELDDEGLKRTVREMAFGESLTTIPTALKSGKWPLLSRDFTTPIRYVPEMPMTNLEKRWLKAISLDQRIKLFDVDFSSLSEVEPLFTPDMIYPYDRYADGDDFAEEGYIIRFKTILAAIRERQPITLEFVSRSGKRGRVNVMPEYLEYSERDDKFRLVNSGCHFRRVTRLSALTAVYPYYGEGFARPLEKPKVQEKTLVFTLFDGRNALERAMLHFAHFEKTVEKGEGSLYTVSLAYDQNDESEILIRILSFGPFIKVTEPPELVGQIRERLKKQSEWGILSGNS